MPFGHQPRNSGMNANETTEQTILTFFYIFQTYALRLIG